MLAERAVMRAIALVQNQDHVFFQRPFPFHRPDKSFFCGLLLSALCNPVNPLALYLTNPSRLWQFCSGTVALCSTSCTARQTPTLISPMHVREADASAELALNLLPSK